MALSPNRYVWNGSSQDDSDATWNSSTIAYLTLQAALTASSAGEVIGVASDHTQTQASALDLSAVSPGASDNMMIIISLDRTDDSYQKMTDTTGDISLTGNSGLTYPSNSIVIGLYFDLEYRHYFPVENLIMIDCDIESPRYFGYVGATYDNYCLWDNVRYAFEGSDSSAISFDRSSFHWRGGAFSLSGSMDQFIVQGSGAFGLVIEDVDLSAIPSEDYLVTLSGDGSAISNIVFKRCKLNSSHITYSGDLKLSATTIKVHSCDDANTIAAFEEYYREGNILSDTGIYLNATYDGTNGYSARMETESWTNEFGNPLRFKLADLYSTANPTITTELVLDSATALNDDDFWIEIEYPDSTIGAYGKIDQTSRMTDIQITPSALTSSSVSWTGTGSMTNEQKRKVAVTISGGQAGVHTVWACLAKPSTTIYVDPEVTIS